jgi:hypothetical protein
MTEDFLKQIGKRLERLEDAVFGRAGRNKARGDSKARQSKEPHFSGATGGVRFLISKGYFKTKLSLSEVRTALSKNGYHYSKQAVHGALINLSPKGGPLVSLQEGGRKVYVERK